MVLIMNKIIISLLLLLTCISFSEAMLIPKEQYDNLIKDKNDGYDLTKDQLNQIDEYESTTLKEYGKEYIPPTSYGDLNYVEMMLTFNKPVSTLEDVEKFKSMLADKIMHDEHFNVVDFARSVKLGDDKNWDGQYSYEEIIRSSNFQRFLTDMQAQVQKRERINTPWFVQQLMKWLIYLGL